MIHFGLGSCDDLDRKYVEHILDNLSQFRCTAIRSDKNRRASMNFTGTKVLISVFANTTRRYQE